ncbi:MAG: hypothetical protein KC516_01860 [Nanoarchaeota archaeon]|nr:hypothetical protein [Nanoarchaeota archaeon]
MGEKKIFLNKVSENDAKKFFPINFLLKNFKVKIARKKEDAEIIVGPAERFLHRDYLNLDKKNLIISGENLFFKRNLLSLFESLFSRFFKEKKYKLIDLINNLFPKKISSIEFSYFLGGYVKLLKKVSKGEIKNVFFVLSNKNLHKRSISFPLFLQFFFPKIKLLIKKKIPSEKELSKKKFCAFVVSSNSSRERIDFFKKLSKYKKVDSYGKVENNMGDLIQKTDWKGNIDLFKKYKFVICFENSFEEDYITEKLPNVMFSCAIPIYRGAQNIGEYFNEESFIGYEKYKNYEKMIKKIIELDKNPKKYISFLKTPWFKNNKIPEKIINKKKELFKFYEEIFSK